MKNKFLSFIFALCLIIPCILFGACGEQKTTFKLNFMVEDQVYYSIDIEKWEDLILPESPQKEGYSFDGWFLDEDVWEFPLTEEILENQDIIDITIYAKFTLLHQHDYSSTVTAPTCLDSGFTTYRCDGCGDSYIDDYVDPIGHEFTNYISDNNATCLQDGTKTATCDNGCGEKDIIKDDGSILSHEFTNYITNNDATCLEDGTKTATCNNGCKGKDTILDVGSALGHKFTNYISDNNATCLEDGTKTATCGNGCGETDTVEDVDSAIGHKFTNYISDNNATTTQDGTKTAVCDNGCGVTDTIQDVGSIINYTIGLKFQKNGEKYFVAGYDGVETEVEFADTYKGLPVTYIMEKAFQDCTTLTKINIPQSVTSIGASAFVGCTGLTNIVIPENVTWIGSSAFQGCTSLEEITLPFVGNSLNGTENTHFGWVFGAKSSRTNYTVVPASLKKIILTKAKQIDDEAFFECENITDIVLPSTTKTIGDEYVFYKCYSLNNITVNENNSYLKSIDGNLYNYYQRILYQYAPGKTATDFTIPNTVTTIWDYAFAYSKNLKNLVMPDTVTTIETGSFYYCGLEKITAPSILFSSQSSGRHISITDLKEVIITSGDTIEASAFSSATNLTSVTIANTIKTIKTHAFSGCTSLTNIVFEAECKIDCIESYAFNECSSLTSFTVPASVTSIGQCSLRKCSSITDIIFEDISTWYYVGNLTDWKNKTNGSLVQYPNRTDKNMFYFEGSLYLYKLNK